MTTRRWTLLFGIRCLLLVTAILPSENSARHHRDDSTVKHLTDDSIRADIKRLNDVTSASSVRKRFVTGRIGEKLAVSKIASSSGKRREKTTWKDIRQEVREMKKNILPVLAGNISYMQLDFKNMDRNFYNVIGEVRFLKNELLYIKHQAHVIWENVTDSRRDHKRISNFLWRILGNVTLALSTIERTSRTMNEFHRTCVPIGQRLERVFESQVGLSDLAYVRDEVNAELGKSKIEVLGSVDGITEEVRGLRRTMVHMGQGLPEFQRHLVSGFVKTEEMLNAGYKQLIGNISDVNSVLFGQTGRIAAIDRSVTTTAASLQDISDKYNGVWNIMVIMFDRVAEIGSTMFVSNANTYQDTIDTRNRLNAIAVQLEVVTTTVNSFKSTAEAIIPRLRAIRRAVWKKCECSNTNRTSQNKEDYDDEDEYGDDDILSIYDENVPTVTPTVGGVGGGGSSTTAAPWPPWYPSQSPPPPSTPTAATTLIYPSSSSNYYPPGYPPGHPPGYPPSHPAGHPPGYPPSHPAGHPPGYPPSHPAGHPPGYPPSNPAGHPPGYPPSHPAGHPPGYPPITIPAQPFPPTFYPTTTPFYYPEGSTVSSPMWYPTQSPFPGQTTTPWPSGSGTWAPFPPPPPPYPTFYPPTTTQQQQTTSFYYPGTSTESWPTWYPGFPGEGTSVWPSGSGTSNPQQPIPPAPTHYPPLYPPHYPSPVPTVERPMWYPPQHPPGQGTTPWPSGSAQSPQGTVPTAGFPIGCNQHFTGYCVCVCACDCICPVLRPVEMAIFGNATSGHPEVPVQPWETDCRCLCPCQCPPTFVLEGPPQIPTFQPPPPPPPAPPFFQSGSGGSPGQGPPPAGCTSQSSPPFEWHHRELLNEIVRANKLLRDDLENTRNLIKAEHATTRQANSFNSRSNADYLVQNTGKQFEESHKLSRESTEMVRVIQTQMKQAVEKTALALKAMAVNIMQFHREMDGMLRQGKQSPSFNPSELVGSKFHRDYHSVPGQPADADSFVYHGNGKSGLSGNQTVAGSTAGRASGRKMITTVNATPYYKSKYIWNGRSGRKRRKSRRRKRGKKGVLGCPVLDQYARGSPYALGMSSKMQTHSGRMLLPDKKMFGRLGDPFSFHNLLQRHIGNQMMNAIKRRKPANNYRKKGGLGRWQKRDRYDLSSLSMFPGFPLIMPPVAPRPRLPPVGFPASVAIGTLPSFVSNVFRQIARDTGGNGAATAAIASSPYSISYNDGKGNSWNVNVANRPRHSTRHTKSFPRLAEEKDSTV